MHYRVNIVAYGKKPSGVAGAAVWFTTIGKEKKVHTIGCCAVYKVWVRE
jgi:hypothetical protein